MREDGRSGMAGAPEAVLAVDDKTDGPAEPDVAAVVEVMAGLGRAVLTAAPPLSQGFGGEAITNVFKLNTTLQMELLCLQRPCGSYGCRIDKFWVAKMSILMVR